MFGIICTTSKHGCIEKSKAGGDVPAGAYTFCRMPCLQSMGRDTKTGDNWRGIRLHQLGHYPGAHDQTLLVESTVFYLFGKYDESAMQATFLFMEDLKTPGIRQLRKKSACRVDIFPPCNKALF